MGSTCQHTACAIAVTGRKALYAISWALLTWKEENEEAHQLDFQRWPPKARVYECIGEIWRKQM